MAVAVLQSKIKSESQSSACLFRDTSSCNSYESSPSLGGDLVRDLLRQLFPDIAQDQLGPVRHYVGSAYA